MPDPFKISVITVCLNAARTIGATIRSVLSQKLPLEYIVVDEQVDRWRIACVDDRACLKPAVFAGDKMSIAADGEIKKIKDLEG